MKKKKELVWRLTHHKTGVVSYVIGVIHPLSDSDMNRLLFDSKLLRRTLLQCEYLVTPHPSLNELLHRELEHFSHGIPIPIPPEWNDMWFRIRKFANDHFISERHLEKNLAPSVMDHIRLALRRLYDDKHASLYRFFAATTPVSVPLHLVTHALTYLDGILYNASDIKHGREVHHVKQDLKDKTKCNEWYEKQQRRWMSGECAKSNQILAYGLGHAMKHKSIFLAVDRAHLVMDNGLLDKLEAKGFSVEPESAPVHHHLPSGLIHMRS